jgi:hypothetical protein
MKPALVSVWRLIVKNSPPLPSVPSIVEWNANTLRRREKISIESKPLHHQILPEKNKRSGCVSEAHDL